MGREIVSDGQGCSGSLSDDPGQFGASHDGRRAPRREQANTRAHIPLLPGTPGVSCNS